MDVKAVERNILMEEQLVLARGFTQNNVTLVSSHQKLALGEPAMRRVITADMLLFLIERRVLLF